MCDNGVLIISNNYCKCIIKNNEKARELQNKFY